MSANNHINVEAADLFAGNKKILRFYLECGRLREDNNKDYNAWWDEVIPLIADLLNKGTDNEGSDNDHARHG